MADLYDLEFTNKEFTITILVISQWQTSVVNYLV